MGAISMTHLPYFLATMVLMTLSPVLIMLSQDSHGHINYSIPSTTLITEAIKIGLSAVLAFPQPSSTRTMSLSSMAQYVVPAVIYCINNNLTFVILMHVHPTTFQLISQLKILFTGLLFRLILKRELHIHQYFAIALVACGSAASQIPSCEEQDVNVDVRTPLWGFLLMVVSCFLSALGGIYSEKLLKRQMGDSIHWQNVQLYAWGILLNGAGTLGYNRRALLEDGFFHGYNKWTWLCILNNALNGLCISALLKFSDNIVRVFAHASAILLTMMLDLVAFGRNPTPQTMVAFAVISISMAQYNTSPPPPEPKSGAKNVFSIADDGVDDEDAECSGLLPKGALASEAGTPVSNPALGRSYHGGLGARGPPPRRTSPGDDADDERM